MSYDSSAKYYENNKERLQKKSRGRHQSLSKIKKGTIWPRSIQKPTRR